MRAHRREFVRQCFGVGASLTALPIQSPNGLIVPRMSEYERILSHTNSMHLLGHPRSWSLVSQGLHPFAPERVIVMRQQNYGDRCGRDLRRKIDKQIEVEFGERESFDRKRFPQSKLESLYWIMDSMCGYYSVPYLEQWVVDCVRREFLASTAWCGMGMTHEFQRGEEVPVDNPPCDWWLFLFPGGIDWAAMDDNPVFAIITHVAHHDASYRAMLPLYVLTQGLLRTDWTAVAQMGRVDACRHLNGITAQCLADLAL